MDITPTKERNMKTGFRRATGKQLSFIESLADTRSTSAAMRCRIRTKVRETREGYGLMRGYSIDSASTEISDLLARPVV